LPDDADICLGPSGKLPELLACKDLGWTPSKRRRRVIDAFAFNGEYAMLEARLRELAPVVNNTAVLTTELNFKGEVHDTVHVPALPGLIHQRLPSKAFQGCDTSRCRLSVTKNSVATVVDQLAPDDEDFVIFSDIDEIPNREIVRLLHECEVPLMGGVPSSREQKVVFKLAASAHFIYSTQCLATKSPWVDPNDGDYNYRGPAILKVKTMRAYGFRTFQFQYRRVNATAPGLGPYATMWDYRKHKIRCSCCSWHLSSFGGLDMFKTKVRDNSDPWRSRRSMCKDMQHCIEENDSVGRRDGLKTVRLSSPATAYPLVPHSVAEMPENFTRILGCKEA